MSAVFARHPELLHAVQPKPLERRSGTFSFHVEREWAALVQRVERGEYRLRAPTATTAGLVPFRGRGDCLVPLLHEDIVWIDPTMPAEDGDLVIVQWHPDTLRKIIERCRDKPEWVATYGENPGDIATKWLRRNGNDYLLVCRQSLLPLSASPFWGGENRILGVVRYIERNGRGPLYGSGELVAHAINQEAIDEIAQASSSGTSSLSTSADTSAYQTSTFVSLNVEPEDVIEISATSRVQVTLSGSATGHGGIRAYYRPSGGGSLLFATELVQVDAGAAQVGTVFGSVTGLTGAYDFGLQNYVNKTGGTGTVQTDTTARTVVATRVKR